MRMRVHSYLSDLAGTGLVLLGFLLIAMAVSATPVLVRTLIGQTPAASSQTMLDAAGPDAAGGHVASFS